MEETIKRSNSRRRNRGRGRRSNRNRQNRPEKKENPVTGFLKRLFGFGSTAPERKERKESSERNGNNGRRRSRRSKPEGSEDDRGESAAADRPQPEVTTPKLYVGNLAYEAAESDLFDLISKAGNVANVEIVRDKNGNSKGFGFVEMSSIDSAKEAVEQFNRTDFMERQIIVSGARK